LSHPPTTRGPAPLYRCADDLRQAAAGARSDEATIEACRRGDRAALGLVFRRYSPAIEGLVYRLVGPRADVEDLLQSTLLAAMGAFPALPAAWRR